MLKLSAYRKKFFVSGRIQGRLMFRIGLYWALYHVVLWNGLFVYRYLQYRMGGGLGTGGSVSQLYRQFVVDSYPIIICALITLPVVVIDILHLTHRIAGPIVQFRRALRDLIDGNQVDQVTLRKGDVLTELQADFNEYLQLLARQRQQVKDSHQVLADEAESRIADHVAEIRASIQSAITTPETTPLASAPNAN